MLESIKNTENATDIKVTIVPNDQIGNEQQVNVGASPENVQRYNVEADPVVVAKDTRNVKLPSNELFFFSGLCCSIKRFNT